MTTTNKLTEPLGFSSSDEERHITHKSKRRGNVKACDVCRRKKIRCNGSFSITSGTGAQKLCLGDPDVSNDPGKPCLNCTVFKTECTFAYVPKKRKSHQAYVESLQRRIGKLELLLVTLAPDIDLAQDIDENIIYAARHPHPSLQIHSSLPPEKKEDKPSPLAQWRKNFDDNDTSDEDGAYVLPDPPGVKSGYQGYFGTSSGLDLLHRLVDMKLQDSNDQPVKLSLASSTRQSWESPQFQRASLIFPHAPLMFSLFELYFRAVNDFFPIIHRPSFEADVLVGRHNIDREFGAVVLLVCAVGSRWSNDQEVLSKAYQRTPQDLAGGANWTSAGWDYYLQTYELYRKDSLAPTSLHDLQMMALGSIYMQGTSGSSVSWRLSGFGVRLAVEVGAHRRLRAGTPSEVQKAMWKRVFWVLVVLDRVNSAHLGRPCAIWDEDIDVDLPGLVDDEYLIPETNFAQPADKPSRLLYFVSLIKLTHVLVYALKTLYPIRRSKTVYPAMSPTWEQDIVVALDSSLNSWVDSVPERLRWDPSRQTDELTFYQSARLHITYHYVQILVHRRYIMPRSKRVGSSPTVTLPSLAICANAARSCSRIFRVLLERKTLMVPELNYFAYSVAVILLYNVWGSNVPEKGFKPDGERKMEDVQACLNFIDLSIERCARGSKLSRILRNLICGQMPDHFVFEPKSNTHQTETDQQHEATRMPLDLVDNTGLSTKYQLPPHVETLQTEPPLNLGSYATDASNMQAYYGETSGASTAPQSTPQNSSWCTARWPAESHDLFNVLDPIYFPMQTNVFPPQNWAGATGDIGWLPSSCGFPSPPPNQLTNADTPVSMNSNSSNSSQNDRPDLSINFNVDWIAQSTPWG